MASYLRPRRGSYNNAKTQLTASNPLKSGEVFFECENIGKAQGKIKLGDATTTYSSLPYFLSMQDSSIGFTNSQTSANLTDKQLLDPILPTASHSTVVGYIKQLLWNHSYKIKYNYDTAMNLIDVTAAHTAAIETLEDSAMQLWTLMGNTQYTTTEQLITTYNSRDLSKCGGFIATAYIRSSNILLSRASVFIEKQPFLSGAYHDMSWVDSQNKQFWCSIRWVSNTKVGIKGSSSDQGFSISLIGVASVKAYS